MSTQWSGQAGWAESGGLVLLQKLSSKDCKLSHSKLQKEGITIEGIAYYHKGKSKNKIALLDTQICIGNIMILLKT